MNNKEIAVAFLNHAASGQVREAYQKFVHKDFTHHNAYFPGDRTSLLEGMEQSAKQFPHKKYETLHAIQDGDLVAVHGRIRLSPMMQEIGVIHILRFKDNLIIEEWEAAQEVPKESPNKNGMF